MRPTATADRALRAPLSQILGRQTHVRLLRVLALRDDPIRGVDLARLTELDPAGVRRSLDALAQTGIVETVGTGTGRQVRLRAGHPLAGVIRVLYAAERDRADAVVEAVRRMVAALIPAPTAAWLAEPVARTPADLLQPIQLGVLTTSKAAAHVSEILERECPVIDALYDVTIEPHVLTEADLAAIRPADRAALRHVEPVLGPPPLTFVEQPAKRARRAAPNQRIHAHANLDARALALASAIADKLARDPDLVRQARAALARRLERAAPGDASALREWEQLLRTGSAPALRRLLVDPGPRATRLRQSLPFVDVLTPAERDAVLTTPPRRRRRP
jgi:hypothetical protein